MAKLYGKDMTREEILKRVNNLEKVAAIKPFIYDGGRAKGVKAFEVSTGSGLEFTVLGSKCLDIFEFKYKGLSLNFMSKPGLTAPEYFNPHGSEFARNFQGGMLYTCGLSNVGTACKEDGREFGTHGRIGSIAAESIGIESRWQENEYIMEISGQMREAALFNENLVLRRKISTRLGGKQIHIHDEVENQGFEPQVLMILYHCNLGYPLLDETARLVVPVVQVHPRDAQAQKGLNSYTTFSKPVDGYPEEVFYHQPASDQSGNTYVGLINESLGLGWYIRYNIHQLPRLIQWKSMMSGDYALGIEPANCFVEGRTKDRERGVLQSISPLETRSFDLEIGVLDGPEEIREFEQKAGSLV